MAGAGWDETATTTGERPLTEGQVRRLIDNCPHLERVALLSLAVATGMRRIDIVRVRRSDLGLESCRVSYREKKGDRIRTVTVPLEDRDDASQVAKRVGWELEVRVSGEVFELLDGACVWPDGLQLVQGGAGAERLGGRPLHALWSTCVKLCQSRGRTPTQTAKHVGDHTIETVQKQDSTPSDEKMRQAAIEKELL